MSYDGEKWLYTSVCGWACRQARVWGGIIWHNDDCVATLCTSTVRARTHVRFRSPHHGHSSTTPVKVRVLYGLVRLYVSDLPYLCIPYLVYFKKYIIGGRKVLKINH